MKSQQSSYVSFDNQLYKNDLESPVFDLDLDLDV